VKIKPTNERGVALILALGLLVIIAAVAVIVVLNSIVERGLTSAERQQKIAFDGMQTLMEEAIAQLSPKSDADSGMAYVGLVDTLPYPGGAGAFRIIAWNGFAIDTLPRKVRVPMAEFPATGGMHQVGEPIYMRYDNMHATARVYRATSMDWVAQKEAQVVMDVGPYGWTY
jgi:hypothetical protein